MVERAFTKVLSNHKSSTEKEDITEHWDMSTNIKFDVKGLKKTKRSDFVFETIDYWIIVDKNDLQEFIKNKIEKDWVYSAALYKLYRRKGREDVITLVKTIDLMYLSSSIITKL